MCGFELCLLLEIAWVESNRITVSKPVIAGCNTHKGDALRTTTIVHKIVFHLQNDYLKQSPMFCEYMASGLEDYFHTHKVLVAENQNLLETIQQEKIVEQNAFLSVKKFW